MEKHRPPPSTQMACLGLGHGKEKTCTYNDQRASNLFWSTPRATPTKHFNWSRTKTSRSTSRRRHLLQGWIILSDPSWRRRSGRFSRPRRPRPGPIPAARPTSSPSTLRRRLVSMIRRKYDFSPSGPIWLQPMPHFKQIGSQAVSWTSAISFVILLPTFLELKYIE